MWFLLSSDAWIWMFSVVRFGDETRWWGRGMCVCRSRRIELESKALRDDETTTIEW